MTAPAADGALSRSCCGSGGADGVDTGTAQELARLFRALADPSRVQLLSIVAAQPDGEACVCDLTEPVGLSQPTVSHHLKILVEAGLLEREKRGVWAYFRLAADAGERLGRALDRAVGDGARSPAG
ncbi:metalloregulator ArsR/SmtB family transcription factor [Auraticoccus sp. F435]|uniref:Metalloregulator ArsR/SmtB family transcription factor n=1 Tax=Auraticoccus cholistanensis TaxID=2656650 RepID=A0A6A9UX46_9ACTN|nr:metalloregulator ArsR/SmtB family transcription factor [Auraticoccus cholistanensis]MVA75817.1 metalloregulator ArsR/SmtB family transcription factor [Auraticoccus cholistanensis]